MDQDQYGEIHPWVDEKKCTSCNMCVKSCPNNKPTVFHLPQKAYAGWITDEKKRESCASGGIATILSESVLKDNGRIYGTKYDAELNPICAGAESTEDLELFKGSKYVQSYIGTSFRDIKCDLNSRKSVLFIGTPCQVDGLYSFLGKEYDNLLTCDLICHGVSPSAYFKEEIAYLFKKKGLKRVTNIRFRGLKIRENFWMTFWDGDRMLYRNWFFPYYLAGFLKGITLREICYSCRYAKKARVSDLTLGDFIGLGNDVEFPYDRHNVSVILLNTSKGMRAFQDIMEGNVGSGKIYAIERSYQEAINGGISLRQPFPRHRKSARFRRLYITLGFVKAIRRVLAVELLIDRSHAMLKKCRKLLCA